MCACGCHGNRLKVSRRAHLCFSLQHARSGTLIQLLALLHVRVGKLLIISKSTAFQGDLPIFLQSHHISQERDVVNYSGTGSGGDTLVIRAMPSMWRNRFSGQEGVEGEM